MLGIYFYFLSFWLLISLLDTFWQDFRNFPYLPSNYPQSVESCQTSEAIFYLNFSIHKKTDLRSAVHLMRVENETIREKLLFQDDVCSKRGRNTNTLFKQVLINLAIAKQTFNSVKGTSILNQQSTIRNVLSEQ